jgi:phosphoglycolate phosphatase
LQALRQSQQSGAILSILSASKQAHLDEVVHDFGIRDLFERVMGIDNHHAAGKLDIGLRWMAEVRAVPEETVLIGDTLHDYEVAQSMGIDCCLIPSGHQNLARLAASGSQVAESITALFDTLMLTG